ncbi:MAG: DUF433 domain-containing protein [Ktedonobacterales bacterium]|nr:DUF433 domain-containing protein [Ktedonobacterales bacterium]
MKAVDVRHIVIEPGVLGGEPHIAGHRIAVSHIAIWIVYQGESIPHIADEFHLTLGEIHAALAYYYDHQDEIDRAIADSDHRHDEMARRYPKGWRPGAEMLDEPPTTQ